MVRGGWPGHEPVECTDSFLPFLRDNGFDVDIVEDVAVYTDAPRLAATDLVVQSWSIGEMDNTTARGLAAAVAAGTGFAGWHGGIVDAFNAIAYMQLTGGRFVYHPRGAVKHVLSVVPGQETHPIVEGIEAVELETEKYWVLTDQLCDVLATVSFPADLPGDSDYGGPETPWRREVAVPAVWTRQWGSGRVFVSTVGHKAVDFEAPEIRAITERGLLWAAR